MNAAVQAGLPDAHGLRALRFRLQGRREVLLAQLREIDLAEAQRDAQELESIGAALRRMESGEYGLCAACGGVIGHARLTANPHALRCVKCEAAHELAPDQ